MKNITINNLKEMEKYYLESITDIKIDLLVPHKMYSDKIIENYQLRQKIEKLEKENQELQEINESFLKDITKLVLENEKLKKIIEHIKALPTCDICDSNWHKGCLCLQSKIKEDLENEK